MIKRLASLLFVVGLLGGCNISKEDGNLNSKTDNSNQIESPNQKSDGPSPAPKEGNKPKKGDKVTEIDMNTNEKREYIAE